MEAAAAMPLAVQRAGATLQALEEGDVKLRVRVLESERADRRQSVMQVRESQCSACICGRDNSRGGRAYSSTHWHRDHEHELSLCTQVAVPCGNRYRCRHLWWGATDAGPDVYRCAEEIEVPQSDQARVRCR